VSFGFDDEKSTILQRSVEPPRCDHGSAHVTPAVDKNYGDFTQRRETAEDAFVALEKTAFDQ
jgi:hypothetical protein